MFLEQREVTMADLVFVEEVLKAMEIPHQTGLPFCLVGSIGVVEWAVHHDDEPGSL